MNIIYIGFLLSVLLLGLIIAKKTKHYFSDNINSVILQMYVYGIHLYVLVYICMGEAV